MARREVSCCIRKSFALSKNPKNWAKHGNLDLHGWTFDRFTTMLESKAEMQGIAVETVSERSCLDILVGSDLKDEYGLDAQERLRLEIRGKPKWSGKQGRLELYHDENSGRFRAIQPVRDCSPQASPLADETAALDIGTNNLVACTTTTGKQYLYEGRDLFGRFCETTERIAEYQSLL